MMTRAFRYNAHQYERLIKQTYHHDGFFTGTAGRTITRSRHLFQINSPIGNVFAMKQRCFLSSSSSSSSTATPKTNSDTNHRRHHHGHRHGENNNLLERVQFLLNPKTNIQVDDAKTWQEIQFLLKQLLGRSNDNDDHHHRTLEMRVQYSIQVLDRLASLLPQQQNVLLFASMLDTSLLNNILYNWCQGIKHYQSRRNITNQSNQRHRLNRQQQQQNWVHPIEMEAKIDKYRWVSLVQPDSKTFTYLLDALTSLNGSSSLSSLSSSSSSSSSSLLRRNKNGIALAEELLYKLIEVSKENPLNILVDTTSFGIIMRAWVRNRHRNGPEKAQEWLRTMQDLYHTHGWQQLQTNAIVYTTIIHGWAQVGKPLEAENLLQEQLQDYYDNNNDNNNSNNTNNKDCRPDTRTFNAVLNAWQKSNDKAAVKRCRDILKQMSQLSNKDNNDPASTSWDCSPDEYSFASYIICCANHLGPEKALEVMESESIPPSVILYNAILRAYVQQGDGQGAERLLQVMMVETGIPPDEITLNTVLSAWSKSKSRKAPYRAESLLGKMQKEYGIRPTVVSFGSALQCWTNASNHNPNGAEQAEQLLRQMRMDGVEPNIICYNSVLNAWSIVARKFRDQTAVSRATLLLHDLVQESSPVQPSELTFRTMLHLIAGSTISNKSERTKAVVRLMEKNDIRPSGRDQKLIDRLLQSNKRDAREKN